MNRVRRVAVVGGGIVGMATAMELSKRPGVSVVVLESEKKLAAHQSGRNSGVIHSGLYYKPGSLKAQTCISGRRAMYKFCEENGVLYERCGKIVVATDESELPALAKLKRRGIENGLDGIRQISEEEIKEREPNIRGVRGLYVPQTGITDFSIVTHKFADIVRENGGEIRFLTKLTGFSRSRNQMVLETTKGEIETDYLINCAGLQSDRIARMCGIGPGLRIVPFRGEYYKLISEKKDFVHNLIYPVPDLKLPFLGPHFTRTIGGEIEVGPSAMLALKREGYTWTKISIKDTASYAFYPGFWRMTSKYWSTGVKEIWRSLSKHASLKAMQKLAPNLQISDIYRSGAGVRAQALGPNGALIDDFKIEQADRMIHVLNAPSPAATASISIGRAISKLV